MMYLYVHPESEAKARVLWPLLFDDEEYQVQVDKDCPAGRIFISSLDLYEDKGDWENYGSIQLDEVEKIDLEG